jgi:hypothetical protein
MDAHVAQPPAPAQGLVVLGDLVVLGVVGIEVVLAVEDRPRGQLAGRPRQTSQVCVLGGSPKDSSQPQNIFVRVLSWTWISRPMTGS